MQVKLFVLLVALSFAAKENQNIAESDGNCAEKVKENGTETIFVKIEEDEYAKINKKENTSQFIGVSLNVNISKWRAQRHSKHEKTTVCNGFFKDEETAARASDTLARKLIANGEEGHKLNFPDDDTEVFPQVQKINSSQFIGVFYRKDASKWKAQRRSKHKKKMVHNGCYVNEEKAAHASDTLARKLIASGEQGHNLNFPDDETEVFPEKKMLSSQYVGVSYDIIHGKWKTQRHSKHEKKLIGNGCYDNEKAAAHASDTVARKLIANGEQGHKLNFSDNDTEIFPNGQTKRKRPDHED